MSKERIAATLKRLLQTTPYSKITVLMICKETPISRNAFYYNFAGKKEVAEWICVENYRSDCLPYHRIDSGLNEQTHFLLHIQAEGILPRFIQADDGVLLHECLMKAHTFGTEDKYAREYGKIEKTEA
jgi:AcrR family transcriptional regulator